MTMAKGNRIARWGTWMVAGGLLAGGVIGLLRATGLDPSLSGIPVVLAAILAIAVMALSFGFGTVWMRSIDEAAQEAHKSAWYWGGSAGMSVGGVLLILSIMPAAQSVSIPTWLPGSDYPAAYAATGAFAMLMLMIIGYGIVWAWWWLSRTRR